MGLLHTYFSEVLSSAVGMVFYFINLRRGVGDYLFTVVLVNFLNELLCYLQKSATAFKG